MKNFRYQQYYFKKDFNKNKYSFIFGAIICSLLICLALLTSFTAKSFSDVTERGAKTQAVTITFEAVSKGIFESIRKELRQKFSKEIDDIIFDEQAVAHIGKVQTYQAKIVLNSSMLRREKIHQFILKLKKEPAILVDLNQHLLERFELFESIATPLKWSVYVVFLLTVILLLVFMTQQWIHSQRQEIETMQRRGVGLNFIHHRFEWLSLSFGLVTSLLSISLYLVSSEILLYFFSQISIHLAESPQFSAKELLLIAVGIIATLWFTTASTMKQVLQSQSK